MSSSFIISITGGKHEMASKVSYISIFYCIIFIFMVTSCCTSSKYIQTGNDVLEHQRRVTELESECQRLRDIISSAQSRIADSEQRVADIQDKAGGISDSIDRVIYLFGEYESEVQRLLEGYDILRRASIYNEEGINSTRDNTWDMLYLQDSSSDFKM